MIRLTRLALLLLLTLAVPALGLGEDSYTLSLSDATEVVGDTAEVVVALSIEGASAKAWQFSICHEDEFLEITEVGRGIAIDELDVSYELVLETESGLLYSCILDDGAANELAAAGSHEILELEYLTEEETEQTELTFCTLTHPDTGDDYSPSIVTVDGSSKSSSPETEDGVIATVAGLISIIPSMAFLRGDADGTGDVFPLLDAIYLLDWGFQSGPAPECEDAADVDNDGALVPILDALALLTWGFLSGDPPAEPGPESCGADPEDASDELRCVQPADSCT